MKNAQYSNFEKVVKIMWYWGLEPKAKYILLTSFFYCFIPW